MPDDFEVAAARDDATQHSQLQRCQCPGSAVECGWRRILRAGTLRLRNQLYSYATGNRPRCIYSITLRRKDPGRIGGPRPEQAASLQHRAAGSRQRDQPTKRFVLPSGTAKIGQREYDVLINASTDTIQALNNLPVKQVNGATIYIRDVANVRDGYTPQ